MRPRGTPSPNEALEWIGHGERFDVVVLDQQGGEMDAASLARELKSLRPDLPIVLLTADDPTALADDARSLFEVTVPKPVRRSALFNAISQAIGPSSETEVSKDGPMPKELDQLRLLLVEDNAVNQKVALAMLRSRGYDADVASDGIEAIHRIELNDYDAVFMDVQMPNMDGLTATREICRRWPTDSRPRIIGMTAHALAGDSEECLNSGMDDYLAKPVTLTKLTEALRMVSPRARSARS
jgi:CheY-like chemotaxis protein